MALELKIGLDAITSYKRLAYTPWHALAEFVDNSTQSFFNNQEELVKRYRRSGEILNVSIVYETDPDLLRISDNAMGMSYSELQDALHVAHPPENTSGRSKYGMGLKTAACWIGNRWKVRTKRLGETTEHAVVIDVPKIAKGDNQLAHTEHKGKSTEEHYTIIEIYDHNRTFQGRTKAKIRDFLRSMYREDFRNKIMRLEWQHEILSWDEFDSKLLIAHDGSPYKKKFSFVVDGKEVSGWVGILDRGSRADAGFSILHCGRVVKGWPDAWRPSKLYGQFQGSNDLVNQRLVGEIHLDEFEVSHTKDDILWLGTQEEDVEEQLKIHCGDYKDIAQRFRKRANDQRGPSDIETATAVDELKRELMSPEMVDKIRIESVPSEEVVRESIDRIKNEVLAAVPETFTVKVGDLSVRLFLNSDMSPNDPYVVTDSARADQVVVIVNIVHPHWMLLKGSEGALNYLRHCTYDAVAEWQARAKAARIDPDTIKILKDKLLRVPFEVEQHEYSEEEAGSAATVN
jgi:hypothetical protein